MKFILIVLAIHFIAALINNKNDDFNSDNAGDNTDHTRHPAEFDLR